MNTHSSPTPRRRASRSPRPILALPALAAAVALVVAGCGGSGGSSGSTSSQAAGTGGASGSSAYGSPSPSSSSSAKPATSAATIATRTTSLGTFLVDGQGRTLYLWEADHGPKSTCTGACAQVWPPLTTTAKPKASGGANASLLGTTKRADGSLEVTYAGHPLYRFAADARPGQTTGQGNDGFGALWWVVKPTGAALTA
jgi:predicted lipoprotein with Yx(FWY)xxD motif